MEEIKWWDEQERLWKELVPSAGQAKTVQGELIRCAGKATDEAYRNGNMNWESGYEELAKYIGINLTKFSVFTQEENIKIEHAVEEIINNFETPDLSGHGSSYYYLTEMAVRFCILHSEPIPNIENSELNI